MSVNIQLRGLQIKFACGSADLKKYLINWSFEFVLTNSKIQKIFIWSIYTLNSKFLSKNEQTRMSTETHKFLDFKFLRIYKPSFWLIARDPLWCWIILKYKW